MLVCPSDSMLGAEGVVIGCKIIPHFGDGYDYVDDPDRFYQSNVAEIQLVAPSFMGIAEVGSHKSFQQWHRSFSSKCTQT